MKGFDQNPIPGLIVSQRFAEEAQSYAEMRENKLSEIIIGKAIEVHKNLGPGLLESTYLECLYFELKQRNIQVVKQKPMPLVYKNIELDHGYRLDLLVEEKVVVELKALDSINEVHKAQLLTYLKLGHYKLGLLMNFNVKLLTNGITRIVNGL